MYNLIYTKNNNAIIASYVTELEALKAKKIIINCVPNMASDALVIEEVDNLGVKRVHEVWDADGC